MGRASDHSDTHIPVQGKRERLGRKNLQTQDSGLRKSSKLVGVPELMVPLRMSHIRKRARNIVTIRFRHWVGSACGKAVSAFMVAAAGGPAVKITPCRWCSWTQIWAEEESHSHQRTSLCHTDPLLRRGSAPVFSDTSRSICPSSGPLWSKHQAQGESLVERPARVKLRRQKRAGSFQTWHLRRRRRGGDGVGGISDCSISLGSFTQANGDSCSFNVPSVQSLAVSHPGEAHPQHVPGVDQRHMLELPINYFSPKANDTGQRIFMDASSVPEIAILS